MCLTENSAQSSQHQLYASENTLNLPDASVYGESSILLANVEKHCLTERENNAVTTVRLTTHQKSASC